METQTKTEIKEVTKLISEPYKKSGAWFEIEYNEKKDLTQVRIYLPARFCASPDKDHNVLYLDKERFDKLFFNYKFCDYMLRWEWGHEDFYKEARFVEFVCGGNNLYGAVDIANQKILSLEMKFT